MNVRKGFVAAALAMAAVGSTPGRASADWYLTPYIGGVFGGNANFNDLDGDFEDELEKRVSFGAALGWIA